MHPTQACILRFIEDYIEAHSIPPALREISEGIGVTLSVTHYHVQQLHAQRKLTITPRQARGIQVVKG